MAIPSPSASSQGREAKPGAQQTSKVTLTQEQVRAIADRVYRLLLRDLKQEWERDRIAIYKSGRLKGGR